MKYFTKEAIFGIPKDDVQRVMTHYGVSQEEAIAKIKKEGIEKLLPQRGSNRRY